MMKISMSAALRVRARARACLRACLRACVRACVRARQIAAAPQRLEDGAARHDEVGHVESFEEWPCEEVVTK